MSRKVSLQQLQDRLPELLDQLVETGEEYVVQRNGQDCAVLVGTRQWRRRTAAQRLDDLGAEYRLSGAGQARAEELLEAKKQRALTPAERRELRALLRESESMLRAARPRWISYREPPSFTWPETPGAAWP